MRFPFFSFRRKAETGTQKKKSGGICCFHAQEPSRPTLFDPSDVAAIARDTSSEGHSRPSEHHTSNGEKTSRTSSYSETNNYNRRSSIAHTAHSGTGTEESESASRVMDVTPMSGFPRRRSVAKGPGLGAVDDEPPSRMSQEHQELDICSLLHPRRHSNSAQAPQLPTRLEVCVDRNRTQPHQPLTTDSAVSMTSDRSIGSHLLSDSSPSSLADSVTPGRRHSSNSKRRSDSSRGTSIRSCSPNAFAGTSFRPEEIASQPTRQATQEVWRQNSNFNEGMPSIHGGQRLSEWHVRMKLDWVSNVSNDLVAEVCLDSRSSPASVTSSSSERARQMVCEITEEDEDNESTKQLPSQDILISNHTNVVDIVDRALAELQREKRTRRHHLGTELTPYATHNKRQTNRPPIEDNTFETEFYRERCSSRVRIRRRFEVLQAFEVLIDKKQQLLTVLDESGDYMERYSKRMLTEAVFHDLKLEISRLAAELENRLSSSDDGLGTQLSSQALRSSVSRFRRQSVEDDDSSQETSSRGKRAKSAPVVSSYHSLGFPDTLSMQRSSSCYTEMHPSLSRLNNGPGQRTEVKGRCTRMESLDEESLFAKMSDLASSTAS